MPKQVVNPNQFKLFMTATEWKSKLTHSTDGPLDVMMSEASGRAKAPAGTGHGSGVHESMLTHGYIHVPESPPAMILEESPSGRDTRVVQSEGHHRIAAGADIEAATGRSMYIPTNVVDNTRAGRRARNPGNLNSLQRELDKHPDG